MSFTYVMTNMCYYFESMLNRLPAVREDEVRLR
jgi:hypothetical protein